MSAISAMSSPRGRRRLAHRVAQLNWWMVGLTVLLGGTGVAMMYAVAGGDFQTWARGHAIRLGFGLVVMLVVALVDIRRWYQSAYWIYGACLLLLLSVEVLGSGSGANRWINLGGLSVQPSEFMRFGLLLALARYLHGSAGEKLINPLRLLVPFALLLLPLGLVVRQPDLGTSVLLFMTGGAVIFAAGLSWRYILVVVFGMGVALPILWTQLRSYQRERIMIFLEPERDPLGAGYHILQSKIAIGSGGFFGRGYMRGSQSQLDFLPEQQTDFIFTMFAEEMGFIGCVLLLVAYMALLSLAFAIGRDAYSNFSRLLACGVGFSIFCYVFVNIAMVMGLLPVVGMPLPLVSYGGSAIITVMATLGLLLSIQLGRGVEMPQQARD